MYKLLFRQQIIISSNLFSDLVDPVHKSVWFGSPV